MTARCFGFSFPPLARTSFSSSALPATTFPAAPLAAAPLAATISAAFSAATLAAGGYFRIQHGVKCLGLRGACQAYIGKPPPAGTAAELVEGHSAS